MLDNLPTYISVAFGLTTLGTLMLFICCLRNSNSQTKQLSTKIFTGLILWLIIQAVISFNRIYSLDTNSLPPKIFLFGILPALLTIITLFLTKNGRRFIDGLPLVNLAYLNVVRVPVEVVLYWLFLNNAIPELMTFEGRNFDIIAGITSPIIAHFGFTKRKINRTVILGWNFICLALLINIVINAFLSAPSPLQKFAFEQPNVAILHFPFSWLPTFIVPVVLFGHLVSIRQLLKSKDNMHPRY